MCTYLKKMRVKNVSSVQKVRNNQINGHKQSQLLKNQPRLFVKFWKHNPQFHNITYYNAAYYRT